MIDIFLVHDDPDRTAQLRNAVSSNSDLSLVSETATGRDGAFALATVNLGHPRIAVVRLNLADMNGFDLVRQIKQKHPDVYIVPQLEGNESGQVWQTLLQLELRDVLNGPVSGPEILQVLQSAAVRSQKIYDEYQERTGGNLSGNSFVISVLGARSGVGKTVLATNLAAGLAKVASNVSLMDFSLNPGDFAIMLDNVPRNTIMDAVQAGGNLDADLLQNLLSPHDLGFRYLASPNQEFDAKLFDYNVASAMMQAIRSISEYVVVDTGQAFSEPAIAAADQSDIIFLITLRDVARLSATQRLIKYLKEREISASKLKVLVSEAEIGEEISESDIEATLEHPVSAYLPSNPASVTLSINRGVPILVSDPGQPISLLFTKLAEYSFNHWQEKPAAGGKKQGKSSQKAPLGS
jgi:pilus assembly protein CpaE